MFWCDNRVIIYLLSCWLSKSIREISFMSTTRRRKYKKKAVYHDYHRAQTLVRMIFKSGDIFHIDLFQSRNLDHLKTIIILLKRLPLRHLLWYKPEIIRFVSSKYRYGQRTFQPNGSICFIMIPRVHFTFIRIR